MWGLEYQIYPAVPQSYRNGKSGQMYNLLSANNVGDNGTLVKKLSTIGKCPQFTWQEDSSCEPAWVNYF